MDFPTSAQNTFLPSKQNKTRLFFGNDSLLARKLRKDSFAGILLVVSAVIAIILANSRWSDAYFGIRDFELGYAPWHLELSIGSWAADGLLAIFFFLVGIELKQELISGELRNFRVALIPVMSAVGGVVVPALIFLMIVGTDSGSAAGWAIPTATDIAFAVSVLALVSSHLPAELRIFLLTLAVIDDLIAVAIIAFVYTEVVSVLPLLVSILVIGLFAFIVNKYRYFFQRYASLAWLLLLPLGVASWIFMHASGVHATIAGVLLGLTVPVKTSEHLHPDSFGLASQLEHRFRPISAGFAVPVFAFFAAGVSFSEGDGVIGAFSDPVTIAIVVALVLGKPVGILLTSFGITRLKGFQLPSTFSWRELAGVSLLAGIGFTVSLLVTDLSFMPGSAENSNAKIGVMSASILAAVLGAFWLYYINKKNSGPI